MCGEDVEEILKGVVEYYFIILPRVNGAHLDCNVEWWYFWFASSSPWMEFEMMIESHRFFSRFSNKCDTDLNLKFAPTGEYYELIERVISMCDDVPCLRDFERWFINICQVWYSLCLPSVE